MSEKEKAALALSVLVDESIKVLQALLELVPMEESKMINLGDVIADLYDYNKAYKEGIYEG